MKEEDRRSLLRHLTMDEYRDIINVCASLPYVTMEVHSTGIYLIRCHFQFMHYEIELVYASYRTFQIFFLMLINNIILLSRFLSVRFFWCLSLTVAEFSHWDFIITTAYILYFILNFEFISFRFKLCIYLGLCSKSLSSHVWGWNLYSVVLMVWIFCCSVGWRGHEYNSGLYSDGWGQSEATDDGGSVW